MKAVGFSIALVLSSISLNAVAKATTYYKCTTTSGCIKVNKKIALDSSYAKTKYPVVLQHGMSASTENTMGSFYGIQEDLAKSGAPIYLTETHGFNSSTIRGEALLKQLETIQAVTKKGMGATDTSKFNLVGHSHGGFDVRYVAAVRPEIVASITGVGTPARGSEVAEVVDKTLNVLKPVANGKLVKAISSVVNWTGMVSDNENVKDGLPQDSMAGLKSLTFKGAAAFNKQFPIAMESKCDSNTDQADYKNGVAYYSWSGTSQFTNPFDPIDYGLAILNLAFKGQPNDGLVSRCSSHVGYVIRDNYKMNHLDEINQIWGMVNWFETNPKSVHRMHINRLKKRGF